MSQPQSAYHIVHVGSDPDEQTDTGMLPRYMALSMLIPQTLS